MADTRFVPMSRSVSVPFQRTSPQVPGCRHVHRRRSKGVVTKGSPPMRALLVALLLVAGPAVQAGDPPRAGLYRVEVTLEIPNVRGEQPFRTVERCLAADEARGRLPGDPGQSHDRGLPGSAPDRRRAAVRGRGGLSAGQYRPGACRLRPGRERLCRADRRHHGRQEHDADRGAAGAAGRRLQPALRHGARIWRFRYSMHRFLESGRKWAARTGYAERRACHHRSGSDLRRET